MNFQKLSNNNSYDKDCITLVACGDIGLYGELEQKFITEGTYAILNNTLDIFKEADLIFGNLEGPISELGTPVNPVPFPNLRMHPDCSKFLKEAGFNIINISNNHMLDYGKEALLDTIERLNEANIPFIGAGKNSEEAWTPNIIRVKNIKIGFFGIHEAGAAASHKEPGASKFEKDLALSSIKKLKQSADIIVVSMHFGFDYFSIPSPYHIRLCRMLIDEGADLILGHHPHVPQPFEKYKNGLIVYSLGNFLFYLGEPATQASKEGFLLKVGFTKTGIKKYNFIPYMMNNDYFVQILDGELGEKKLIEYIKSSLIFNDPQKIRLRWYQNIRNYYLGYIAYYWKKDLKKEKNFRDFLNQLIRLFDPTMPNGILIMSLIGYLITGYLLKNELKKLLSYKKKYI